MIKQWCIKCGKIIKTDNYEDKDHKCNPEDLEEKSFEERWVEDERRLVMEAKIDELLKQARILEPNLCADRERYIAEISFRAGIREVVEWIERGENSWWNDYYLRFKVDVEEWQAQKKEWGIK